MLIGVNYHYIRESFDTPYPSIFGVTPQEFSQQLDLLGQVADFLSLRDIVEVIEGKKKLPSRGVVITIDDGLKEQYDLGWSILKEKGIPAIFFVNTKPIDEDFVTSTHKIHLIRAYTHPDDLLEMLKELLEAEGMALELPEASTAQNVYVYDTQKNAQLKYFLNHMLDRDQQARIIDQCFSELGFDEVAVSKDLYMSKTMTAELAKAGCLGTHGHAHRPLGLLDEDVAKTDLDVSTTKLREWTGGDVEALSYPFGFKEACNRMVAQHAENLGIKLAFTMEGAGNQVIDAPMFMARFSPNDVFYAEGETDLEEFWCTVKHASWFR